MTSPDRPGRRAVFLDIDGTYAQRGIVPEAHVAAVRAARSAGNAVLLCTGRPRSMVPERIMSAGFDGFVGGAGAYVEVGGTVLADRRFPADLAARAVEVLDAHDVAYLLEAPDVLHGAVGVDERLAVHFAARFPDATSPVPHDILDRLVLSADLTTASFGKITCFDSSTPIPALVEEMGPQVAALPASIPGLGERAGEIYLVGVHKGIGMRLAAEHLGLPMAQVVAVGDGLNDLEMVAEAGVGVAIEGADPRLLAVADRVAPGPERAGLVTLFDELGLV
ncbi:Cof-type HAD-IIB family hydrolase [Actinotalea sp. M2MS4P-6]|uniref:HAD hydrolase family protein n=1 Tax=Actinotalea sp. M2MS4P-6 TaxID=2983762 RepID=UPI0021E3D6CB|nr:HAD family hydrolase [Actinotalea sp. M2MS4P-6]MCV2395736.1 Cof-type HAD-IIB family hydrolase [Actinotalea sp. M2MS4P-6]